VCEAGRRLHEDHSYSATIDDSDGQTGSTSKAASMPADGSCSDEITDTQLRQTMDVLRDQSGYDELHQYRADALPLEVSHAGSKYNFVGQTDDSVSSQRIDLQCDGIYWKPESRGSRSTKTISGLTGPVMSSRETGSVSLLPYTEANSGEGIVNYVGSVSHQSPGNRPTSSVSRAFLQLAPKNVGLEIVHQDNTRSDEFFSADENYEYSGGHGLSNSPEMAPEVQAELLRSVVVEQTARIRQLEAASEKYRIDRQNEVSVVNNALNDRSRNTVANSLQLTTMRAGRSAEIRSAAQNSSEMLAGQVEYRKSPTVSQQVHSVGSVSPPAACEIVNEWSRDQQNVNRPSSQLSGSSQSSIRMSDREVARILADLAARDNGESPCGSRNVSPLSVSAARIPIFDVSRNGIPVCTSLQTSAGVSLTTPVRSEVARLSPEIRAQALAEVGFSPVIAQQLVSRAVVNNEPCYSAFSGEVLAASVVSSVPVATSHLQYRQQLSPVASNAVNVKCRENRNERRSQSVTPVVGRRVSVNVSQPAIRCDDDIEMSEFQPTVSRATCQQFPTEYCDQNTYYRPVNGILRDRAVFPSQKRVNENNYVSQTGSAMRVTDSCEQNYIDRSDCVRSDRCSVRVSSVNQPVRRHDVVTTQAHNMTDAWAWTNSDSLYVSQPVNGSEVIRSDVCALSSF